MQRIAVCVKANKIEIEFRTKTVSANANNLCHQQLYSILVCVMHAKCACKCELFQMAECELLASEKRSSYERITFPSNDTPRISRSPPRPLSPSPLVVVCVSCMERGVTFAVRNNERDERKKGCVKFGQPHEEGHWMGGQGMRPPSLVHAMHVHARTCARARIKRAREGD